jgi:hypothetical protein
MICLSWRSWALTRIRSCCTSTPHWPRKNAP